MTRHPSAHLRSILAVLLLSPFLAPAQAAAQAAKAPASAVPAAAGIVARAPLAIGVAPLAPSVSIGFAPAPNVLPALAPSALKFSPAASQAAPALEAVPAASARAAVLPVEKLAVRGAAASALTGVFHADSNSAAAPAAAEAGLDVLFDGGTARRHLDAAAPFAAGFPALNAASTLERHSPAVSAIPKAVPPAAAKAKRAGMSFGSKALLLAALLIAAPGLALAAAAGPLVATAAASLSFLASIQPLASAAGAVAGAIYGMFAARPKDGSAASSGEVFASILRYGILGGAGAYVLLDLSQIAFTGASAVGLKPLTSAIAIAALGRTAFQDKFTDPATTSADRIMGAFPAVAAAVGISVGVALTALAAPALSFVVATGAMAATGVATALYAATYKPGRSPADGPATMAKGFVLQALMMGLALAVTNPLLFWPFAALGTAGFALVLWAAARQVWSLRPGAPAQPLPPAPPIKPVPPVVPPVTPPAPKP